MNRENLKKLADGLRGPLEVEFDMDTYAANVDSELELTRVSAYCGTAACACGHATYLVKPKDRGEDFEAYSERLFGLNPNIHGGGWDWCFSCRWKYVDNTPEGAADRIDWMLQHGVPRDALEQMMGEAPLCYRTAP